MDDTYEDRIASLFADVPDFKRWLDDIRGLATDAHGRTIILGLDTAETEEMIRLRAVDFHGPRYSVLRKKHDDARQADAIQNLAWRLDGKPQN